MTFRVGDVVKFTRRSKNVGKIVTITKITITGMTVVGNDILLASGSTTSEANVTDEDYLELVSRPDSYDNVIHLNVFGRRKISK